MHITDRQWSSLHSKEDRKKTIAAENYVHVLFIASVYIKNRGYPDWRNAFYPMALEMFGFHDRLRPRFSLAGRLGRPLGTFALIR